MRRTRRVGAVVVALIGVLSTLVADPGAARAADSSSLGIQLMAQTPWVAGANMFDLDLSLNGAPPGSRVEVEVYDQLITRSSFDAAASGHLYDSVFYRQSEAVSALPPGSSGGTLVALPINKSSSGAGVFPTVQVAETGVFPVKVTLTGPDGSSVGNPLITFLTHAQEAVSQGHFAPFSAAVVVPFSSTPVVDGQNQLQAPSRSEAARLNQLATALEADSDVRASVLASPITLASLAAGSSNDDVSALTALGGSPQGGLIQVLPSTYSPVSVGDLASAGAGGEVDQQLNAGAQELSAVFGGTPDPSTWVVNGPLDGTTLQTLLAHHVTRVIVPDSDLSAITTQYGLTFAQSTYLNYGGQQIQVYAADAGLTKDFTRGYPPVLAANVLLAEMAMIYTEYPGVVRAVVAMPPSGWTVSPTFMSTLLGGLHDNPLISSVTASGIFSAVPGPDVTRILSDTQAGPTSGGAALAAASGLISSARTNLNALAAVLPDQVTMLHQLANELLIAESESLGSAQRFNMLASIVNVAGKATDDVSLPPSSTITLTSTKGQIPITMLATGNLHPRVQLQLISGKLIFRKFKPANGSCEVPYPQVEVCTISLMSLDTTVKVPVETRSSGVFSLLVKLYSPDGSRLLAHEQDTVRSTAVSGVAIVLIGIALVMLVLWWGRDLRRGRRPKGMVPSPVADADVELGTEASGVDEFFRRPPPQFGTGLMSPSSVRTGPITPTDIYGPGRETRE